MRKILPKKLKTTSIRKYTLYALGEMFLIVISLFLALQLNNLNEIRKNNKRIERYKVILMDDLKKDLKQIELTKKQFQLQLDEIEDFRKRLNALTANVENLKEIVSEEFNPNTPAFVRYTRNTWEAMKSTGDVGLLEQEILNGFNSLHEIQSEEIFYQELSLSLHASLLENYMQKYPTRTGLINQGSLYEKVWEHIDENDLILSFNAMLTIKMGLLEGSLRYYDKIETETLELMKLLKNE